MVSKGPDGYYVRINKSRIIVKGPMENEEDAYSYCQAMEKDCEDWYEQTHGGQDYES
jgi:hypothetical protein